MAAYHSWQTNWHSRRDIEKCWKNEQYSRRDYIENIGIPDTTNETKVCELIETAAGISITLTVWKLVIVYILIKMMNLSLNFQEEKTLK